MNKTLTIFSIITLLSVNIYSSGNQKVIYKFQKNGMNTPLHYTNIYNNSASGYSNSSSLISYINNIRAKGAKCAPPAPPLHEHSSLKKAAFAHSKDMAVNNFLRHNGSGSAYDIAKPKNAMYSNFADRLIYFGYPIKPKMLIGENITYTLFKKSRSKSFSTNFKRAVNIWLNDREHCLILMNPRFKYIGIGYQKRKDRYYFTADFAEKSN